MSTFADAFADYIIIFVSLSFTAYGPQSPADLSTSIPASLASLSTDDVAASLYEAGIQGRQFAWQKGWSTFYWAWWIAFSPFVGLFLARISIGRTIREFILGCVIAPAIVCFLWMAILGGAAIDLEFSNIANGEISAATNTAKLFVTLEQMLSGGLLTGITIMCVVLILTFLVTSADSGILVINTIMSGGRQDNGIKHRVIWGVILTALIGALLIAGNSGAAENPFSAFAKCYDYWRPTFCFHLGTNDDFLGQSYLP
jgi:choline-glycine betaine transporter